MASSGPRYPTSVSQTSSGGTNGFSWSSLTNIYSDNNADASCIVNYWPYFGQSAFCQAATFGFSIPTGATIDGIVVEAEKRESYNSNFVGDYKVQIVKGGTAQGDNKAKAGGFGGTTRTNHTYGSSTDLWGVAWTAADINSSGFGVAVSHKTIASPGAHPTAYWDYVRITVYYTEAPAGIAGKLIDGGLIVPNLIDGGLIA